MADRPAEQEIVTQLRSTHHDDCAIYGESTECSCGYDNRCCVMADRIEAAPAPSGSETADHRAEYAREREKVEELVAVGHKHGWDGVNNSKILAVFLDCELTELARLRAVTAPPVAGQGTEDTRIRPFDKRGADRLAEEVAKLVRNGTITARHPAADALLDYAPERCTFDAPATPSSVSAQGTVFPDASYQTPLRVRLEVATHDGPTIPRMGIRGTDKHSVPLTSAEARQLLDALARPSSGAGATAAPLVTIHTITGAKMSIMADPSVPRGEVHFRDSSGRTVGRIVDAFEATPPHPGGTE